MQGQVQSGEVLDEVSHPPGLPRFSISSTSSNKVTGFFSFFMTLPPGSRDPAFLVVGPRTAPMG